MAERVPCIDIDSTEGCMNRLAKSICLINLLVRHNDPADDFHMDGHQVVKVSHQFKHGVTFMILPSKFLRPHLLNTMAGGDNCCLLRRAILIVYSIGAITNAKVQSSLRLIGSTSPSAGARHAPCLPDPCPPPDLINSIQAAST